VLLLGGPNTYLPFLQECWRLRIPETWESAATSGPRTVPIEELIFVPENAQYYAAFGAVRVRHDEPAEVGVYRGLDPLEYITNGRKARSARAPGPPSSTRTQRDASRQVPDPPTRTPSSRPARSVRGVIGLDGGSTSSKACSSTTTARS
jgi:activator of 2-hydroxyglutaryl-CoA dehydratase